MSVRKTLEQLLQPLLDVLNNYYSSELDEECGFGLPMTSFTIGARESEACITLPDTRSDNPMLARAVATLMRRSAMSLRQPEKTGSERDLYREPLRFGIEATTICTAESHHFARCVCLIVGHPDPELALDVIAAAVQINLLAEYLKDDANLIELTGDNADAMYFEAFEEL